MKNCNSQIKPFRGGDFVLVRFSTNISITRHGEEYVFRILYFMFLPRVPISRNAIDVVSSPKKTHSFADAMAKQSRSHEITLNEINGLRSRLLRPTRFLLSFLCKGSPIVRQILVGACRTRDRERVINMLIE